MHSWLYFCAGMITASGQTLASEMLGEKNDQILRRQIHATVLFADTVMVEPSHQHLGTSI